MVNVAHLLHFCLSSTKGSLWIHQVVPVSYFRFSTSPARYTLSRDHLTAFPLGVLLTFTVHFHAHTGEALHSSSSHLTFSTNRLVIAQALSLCLGKKKPVELRGFANIRFAPLVSDGVTAGITVAKRPGGLILCGSLFTFSCFFTVAAVTVSLWL